MWFLCSFTVQMFRMVLSSDLVMKKFFFTVQTGNELLNILTEFSHTRKKPPPSSDLQPCWSTLHVSLQGFADGCVQVRTDPPRWRWRTWPCSAQSQSALSSTPATLCPLSELSSWLPTKRACVSSVLVVPTSLSSTKAPNPSKWGRPR